jgi:hypothetical protein
MENVPSYGHGRRPRRHQGYFPNISKTGFSKHSAKTIPYYQKISMVIFKITIIQ